MLSVLEEAQRVTEEAQCLTARVQRQNKELLDDALGAAVKRMRHATVALLFVVLALAVVIGATWGRRCVGCEIAHALMSTGGKE